MKKSIITTLALMTLLACKDEHKAYQQKESTGREYVARSPSGKLSPIFTNPQELKSYIKKNSTDFPAGTVILDR